MSTSIPKPWAEITDDAAAVRSHQRTDHVKTILLVDDDAVTLTVCGGCLEEAGYRVLRAKSGLEAIRLCGEHAGPIHLLLTDYVLAPQTLRLRAMASRSQPTAMNGLQLMREIQAARPATHVIVMSGHTDANLESLYRFKNGRPFLRKPFNLDTLLRLVRETLEEPASHEPVTG